MSMLEKYTKAINNKDESTMNELLHNDFKFTMHKSGNTLGKALPKVFPDLCIVNLKSLCKSSFIVDSSLLLIAFVYFSNIDILYSFNNYSITDWIV